MESRLAVCALLLGVACSCGGGGGGGSDAGLDTAGDPVEDAVEDASEDPAGDPVDDPVDDAPAGCPLPGDLGSGNHDVTLEHDSMTRDYIVHVPPGYDPATPTALVLNLHGYTSNAEQQVPFSNMNATADAEGFIALYPNGYENSWNGGACCGQAAAEGIDDVGFLVSVVADVSTRLCIDPDRVYASGMSNGGYMSHRLACEASDVFAAVAPVAGGLGILGCSPPRPVPVIMFHGTDDSVVPFSSAETALSAWGSHDSCTSTPVTTSFGDSYCDVHETCEGGAEVGLCALSGMDHCWPGGAPPRWLCETFVGTYSEDINANDYMWEFFTRHPMP